MLTPARLGLLAVAAAAAAAFVLLRPEQPSVHHATIALPPAAAGASVPCDLNVGACSVSLSGGRHGTLDVQPRPVAVMQALQVTWQEDATPDSPQVVHLQFEGVEMEMGFNRVQLARTAPGRYAGSAMLPVCTTGTMRWRARIDRGAGRPVATIEFDAPVRP